MFVQKIVEQTVRRELFFSPQPLALSAHSSIFPSSPARRPALVLVIETKSSGCKSKEGEKKREKSAWSHGSATRVLRVVYVCVCLFPPPVSRFRQKISRRNSGLSGNSTSGSHTG